MLINKLGKYKTNQYYTGYNEHGSWSVLAGTEFDVTQISEKTGSFFSTTFGSWRECDINADYIDKND